MNDFEKKLKFHMECIVEITDKIDNRQEYMEELKKYLPYMNQVIPEILKKSEDPQIEFELNDEFVKDVSNFETVDAYKEDIKKMLTEEKAAENKNRY